MAIRIRNPPVFHKLSGIRNFNAGFGFQNFLNINIWILRYLFHVKYKKNQHVLNWTYGLFGKYYRVAILSTFYLTVSWIIITSLKYLCWEKNWNRIRDFLADCHPCYNLQIQLLLRQLLQEDKKSLIRENYF